ncbi:PadR family transcriptional regulator [Streptosporangium sp. NPDC050855]|uniref:PadR family transcriptional regulator n=1 Tax=Streptosporangium sp. NPDC050855 TaxID=3366194 RepID=UPI0037BBEDCE
MSVPERVTGPLLDVLEVLLQALQEKSELHGWAMAKMTGRSGPTIYGVIDRLEDAGWVRGRWEDNPQPNKPRRKLYTLTPTGAVEARSILAQRRPATGRAHPGLAAPGTAFIRWLGLGMGSIG